MCCLNDDVCTLYKEFDQAISDFVGKSVKSAALGIREGLRACTARFGNVTAPTGGNSNDRSTTVRDLLRDDWGDGGGVRWEEG
jgi:hypothetical protein